MSPGVLTDFPMPEELRLWGIWSFKLLRSVCNKGFLGRSVGSEQQDGTMPETEVCHISQGAETLVILCFSGKNQVIPQVVCLTRRLLFHKQT